jgi:hypothetical protein
MTFFFLCAFVPSACVPAKSSSRFCINLKKQSQSVKVPDWRKYFDNKILYEFLWFGAREKQSQNKPN